VSIKKGFTLIEIMIVLAIIALLSVILMPKVEAIKLQSKNNSVTTNVLLVRTYLENRSGKDAISYETSTTAGDTQETALANILSNNDSGNTGYTGVGPDMTSDFSGSNALVNPFNNNSSIVYSQGNVTNKGSSSTSAVLLYYSTDTLPADNSSVSSSAVLPSGTGFAGSVVVVVYSTGYVLYGVDNSGQIISVYIIKFPPTPLIAQSGVTGGSGGNSGGGSSGNNTSLTGNIGDVVSYIKSIAIYSIITGVPNGQMWNVIQGPLYDNLYNQFTPGNTSKHIVNPYFLNVDAIGNENGYVDPNLNYSIISNPQPDYSNVDTKYSNRPGTVIVYVTNNPVGYVVYGIDQNGNTIDETPINLSTEVTSQMTQTLANNVTSVYNTLINNIDSNISKSSYGNVQSMADLAYSQLKGLSINNAYISSWSGKEEANSGNFEAGYALVVGGNDGGASYSDYKGSVIVDTLSDGSGYDIYGIDYNGNKYADIKVVSVNTLVNNNYDLVVSYLQSVSLPNTTQSVQNILSSYFGIKLNNPYSLAWNDIVYATDSNVTNQHSVIVCNNNVIVQNSNSSIPNYKGCVIVQAHDSSSSPKKYDIYSIGSDGSIIQSTTIP
jgi:prepilin-type N-terminal cleavage/methylation domain-containing protein